MNKGSPDISSEVESSLQLVVVSPDANEFLERNTQRNQLNKFFESNKRTRMRSTT